MNKNKLMILLLVGAVLLAGWWFMTNQQAVDKGVVVEISEDDSLGVIEEELNDTNLQEFDAELDKLDEEINQL